MCYTIEDNIQIMRKWLCSLCFSCLPLDSSLMCQMPARPPRPGMEVIAFFDGKACVCVVSDSGFWHSVTIDVLDGSKSFDRCQTPDFWVKRPMNEYFDLLLDNQKG
jgi:hypothetical protein